MNWDAIGAVAELSGAVAVIVSIIYLAVQVRQTRLQLRSQAEDYAASRAFDAYDPVYQGDNAGILRRGLENPDSLNDDDAFIFHLLLDRQRGAFATIVHRKHNGVISTSMAEHLLKGYKRLFLHTAGGKYWLQETRESLSRLERQELGLDD